MADFVTKLESGEDFYYIALPLHVSTVCAAMELMAVLHVTRSPFIDKNNTL